MASGEKSESNLQDVFHRLVRALGGRGEATAAPTTLTTPQQTPTTDVEMGPELKRVPSKASSKSNRNHSSISERLKSFGKDLGMSRRGSTAKPSDSPLSPRTTLVTIPGTTTGLAEAGPSQIQSGPAPISHAKLLSMVEEESAADTPPPGTEEPPEPTSLAQRIQMLVDSLPTPNSDISRSPRITKPPARDPSGRPIPPPNPTPIKDSRLKAFLNSATIMNGSSNKGMPSIWSILESLGAPPHDGNDQTGDGNPQHEPGEGDNEGDEERDIYSDSSSVMMYSPLLPTKEDLVELAELVVLEAGQEVEVATGASGWTTMWPFSAWNPPKQQQPLVMAPDSPHPLGRSNVGGKKSSDSTASDGKVKTQSRPRGWVPSPTKLSVQAFWWGYRLYLPPPVLAVLSDKTLEATKRAAMITTALTWFFNNLPITSFPAPLQPALLLLQRIAPFLGYIGTFISWSWSTIKSYDVGFGVYLTATWILPIALIPGTWTTILRITASFIQHTNNTKFTIKPTYYTNTYLSATHLSATYRVTLADTCFANHTSYPNQPSSRGLIRARLHSPSHPSNS
ncbi:uncharacterized protein LACBIDRAFT_295792 [Laccaria bicolor S238N-H82]|uniref:Predicted protein n=1 Tax=Laccaria bicolor (strain S238N-H82 / ATCC MYA-4686) TaxID=486041 RepID=B0DYG2_LACBS|nr:uncharacterized protein LACBIDRAFT_295792 [Laccaria bicolor S238N-H82]EDR00433.1 predicted protein [Laccaria bicolor S238N-H82]|eukprot:XP_001888992.1 predicted protein [Laccaria bicolor S238N-H82]